MAKKIYSVTYTTSYTYNLAGGVVNTTYPSGRVVKHEYDNIGRLKNVKNNSTGASYVSNAAYSTALVLRVIYEMTEPQFKRYWIAKIFRAESATAPKTVYCNQMALELVTAVPGAIAFVDARDVKPGVKVLRVDGHKPGEPGYPLR